jgi:drug/metabolite transporter (DMT)-like permease
LGHGSHALGAFVPENAFADSSVREGSGKMAPTPPLHADFRRSTVHVRSADVRAAVALAAAALLWSGNFIVGRALRDDIDPITLNLYRWALCLLIFLPWVGPRAWRCRHVVAREWRLLLALGITGIAAFQTLVYFALTSTTAINALLMLSSAPTAILVGAALTSGSRPSREQWVGTLVSLVGACILVTRGSLAVLLDLSPARGDLWMIVAVLLWAVYSLLLRRRPPDLPQDVTLASSMVPAVVLLLAAKMTAPAAPLALTPSVVGGLIYVAVFASLIAFLLWSYGVSLIGPERAGQYLQLMPVFGAMLAMALLGETIVLPQVVGALCVLAGIALVERRG